MDSGSARSLFILLIRPTGVRIMRANYAWKYCIASSGNRGANSATGLAMMQASGAELNFPIFPMTCDRNRWLRDPVDDGFVWALQTNES